MDRMAGNVEETFGQRKRRILREFETSLLPVGEILLDFSEDVLPEVTEGVTDLAEWFDSLDTSTQKTILSTAGFLAALGPVNFMLGSTFKTVSTLTSGLSQVTQVLGKSNGVGLISRLGMLGPAGIAGVAIGGLTLVGGAINKLTSTTKELNDISFETADSFMNQYETTDQMIGQFEKLRNQSELTKDEFARYVDLHAELKDASDPKVIEDIEKEWRV